jgi:hypothetical protein
MNHTTPLAQGLHYGIPARVYHADPCELPSLSSGIARTLIAKTAAHARLEHTRLGGTTRKLTPALSLGGYVHALVAGDVSEYAVEDFPSMESKAAKEWAALAQHVGKEPVLQRTADAATPIAQAINANWRRGLTPHKGTQQSEVTAIWREGDAWCRARFDRLCVDDGGFADIWDWKTTDDVSDHAIMRSIADYGYYIQVAFYLRGLAAVLPSHRGRSSFILVFVEKNPPYSVRRVTLSPAALAQGARDVNMAIAVWKQAMATGEWPGYDVSTTEMDLPSYMQDDDVIAAS